MTRLLLIRHAESEWNAQGRWQGQADPVLSERGRAKAKEAAARLDGLVQRIVSSNLLRAAATADIIGEQLGLGPVERFAELREIDVGEWSGLTSAEIEERWPGAIERYRNGEDAPPGGESRVPFRERIVSALESVARTADVPALVVTHGGAIGVLERHLDVHPGRGMPKLSGRWFEFDGELRAIGDRIALVDPDVS